MNESDYIFKLSRYLKELGATVKLDLNLEFVSSIDFSEKVISLNEPNALKALMCLAYEGGLYLHFLRNSGCYIFRDEAGYLLGWHLLKKIGVVEAGLVSKDLWKEYRR